MHHVGQRGKRQARCAANVDDVGTSRTEVLACRRMASLVSRGALLISARISISHAPCSSAAAAVRNTAVSRADPSALSPRAPTRPAISCGSPSHSPGMSTRSVPGGTSSASNPGSGHQGRHGDLQDGHVVRERRRHFRQHAPQCRLGKPPCDEQDAAGLGRCDLLHQRGSPLHELVRRAFERAPSGGRQRTASSILRASSKSLSVIPPALCVISFTVTRAHVTVRSGW